MKQKVIVATVIVLTLTSQLVSAESITDTYAKGDTLTATKMNNIKTAVNDNDGNINTNTANTGINTTNINTNTDNISTNTSDISGHETRISNLETFNKIGVLYAIPTSCMRGTSDKPPFENTRVFNPPGNTYGPSLGESSQLNGTYIWYCDVPIQVPAGTIFTITGATLAYHDSLITGSTCLVGAQIKTKTFGIISAGTLVSEVYSGVDANDFSATASGAATKSFPPFSQVISTDTIVFINAIIKNTSGTGGDCRYSGIRFDYSITQ